MNATTGQSTSTEMNRANAIAYTIGEILKYYPPIVVIPLGVVGNILSYLIMNQPRFKHATTSFYMRMIALGDTGFLVSFCTVRFALIWGLRQFLIDNNALRVVCLQFLFFWKVFSVFPRYVLVVMTFDRLLSLAFVLRAKSFSTVHIAKITVTVIFSISIGEGIPFLLAKYSDRYSHWVCPYHMDHLGAFLDFTIAWGNISTTTCCALLLLANVVIIAVLSQGERRRKKLQAETNTEEKENKNRQISMMLLTASTFFIISNIPREFDLQFWPKTTDVIRANKGFKFLSLEFEMFMESLAYSTNFLCYVASCAKFRLTLKQMLTGDKKSLDQPTSVMK